MKGKKAYRAARKCRRNRVPARLRNRKERMDRPRRTAAKKGLSGRSKKALAGAAVTAVLAVALAVVWPAARQLAASPESVRETLRAQGALAPLAMIGLSMLHVVLAFLPGEPFELAAGYAFGWLPGMALCLTGYALASALVFLAVRKWGMKLVEVFFSRDKIESVPFLREGKRLRLLIFLMYLIPGTPKDLLTWLTGLTPVPLGSFLWLSALARIPSVLSSTMTGGLAQQGRFGTAAVLYGITLALSGVCVAWYRRLSRKENENGPKELLTIAPPAAA